MSRKRNRTPVLSGPPLAGQAYLSSRQAQEYLGFTNLKAFLCSYRRFGIQPYRLGRLLKFKREDLDAALTHAHVEEPTARRKRA